MKFYYNKIVLDKKIIRPFIHSFIHYDIKYQVLQSIDIEIKNEYLYINDKKFKIIINTGYCHKINKKDKTISTINIDFLQRELNNMADITKNINCSFSRAFFELLCTITEPKTYYTAYNK